MTDARRNFTRWLLPALALLFLGFYYVGAFLPRYRPALYVAHPASIALEKMSRADFVRLDNGTPRNYIFHLQLANGGAVTQASTIEVPRDHVAMAALESLFATFSFLLAAYVGFRRPGAMTAAFLFYVAGLIDAPLIATLVTRLPDSLYLLVVPIVALFGYFPNFALASFAIRFPESVPTRGHRIAMRIVDTIVALAYIEQVLQYAGLVALRYDNLARATEWYVIGSVLLTFTATMLSLLFAKRGERSRTAIVFAAIMLGGVGYALAGVIEAQTGLSALSPTWLYDAAVAAVTVAVAYAILKHRVLDIGFVLNRTIVFAATSAIVVTVLAALEFLAERYLDSLTRVESILVQFGIALVVTFGIRVVHARVDRFVDTLFFRKRHEDERAIRTFAREAAYITDDRTLLDRTRETLEGTPMPPSPPSCSTAM